jgi:hypothetical protein
MAEFALAALERTLVLALEAPGAVWGANVYNGMAKAGTPYPYLIFYTVGGGEDNDRKEQDATYLIGVKCVSNRRGQALAGALQISTRLNDQGAQDSGNTLTVGGTDWMITTCTQERIIDVPDTFQETEPVYHVGGVYRIVMGVP